MGDYNISTDTATTPTGTNPTNTPPEPQSPIEQAKSALKKAFDAMTGRKR